MNNHLVIQIFKNSNALLTKDAFLSSLLITLLQTEKLCHKYIVYKIQYIHVTPNNIILRKQEKIVKDTGFPLQCANSKTATQLKVGLAMPLTHRPGSRLSPPESPSLPLMFLLNLYNYNCKLLDRRNLSVLFTVLPAFSTTAFGTKQVLNKYRLNKYVFSKKKLLRCVLRYHHIKSV